MSQGRLNQGELLGARDAVSHRGAWVVRYLPRDGEPWSLVVQLLGCMDVLSDYGRRQWGIAAALGDSASQHEAEEEYQALPVIQ